ncbi:Ketopantoate reductase [Pseudomonas syringae pv. actinidiae]|uniref:Ketopantoate reductase n=1 Tax=Pseudomonas syringae pv. actinidiae TaxID=103796 RepID=A0AAN4Q6V0_PSESF|nr:Ketopantoate reductase [Pseudomonas syringae pv. actinidiae]
MLESQLQSAPNETGSIGAKSEWQNYTRPFFIVPGQNSLSPLIYFRTTYNSDPFSTHTRTDEKSLKYSEHR